MAGADRKILPLAQETTSDAPTHGSIGPVHYYFAPELLTRAEVQLAFPPHYDAMVWATKLIPVQQAALLGTGGCRSEEASGPQVCTAENVDGLAMARLERPIADYRRAFAEAGRGDAELKPSMLAGRSGFEFSASAEGSGITYSYYPIGERTLLLAHRFSDRAGTLDPAIRSVLESLRLPDDAG